MPPLLLAAIAFQARFENCPRLPDGYRKPAIAIFWEEGFYPEAAFHFGSQGKVPGIIHTKKAILSCLREHNAAYALSHFTERRLTVYTTTHFEGKQRLFAKGVHTQNI